MSVYRKDLDLEITNNNNEKNVTYKMLLNELKVLKVRKFDRIWCIRTEFHPFVNFLRKKLLWSLIIHPDLTGRHHILLLKLKIIIKWITRNSFYKNMPGIVAAVIVILNEMPKQELKSLLKCSNSCCFVEKGTYFK